VVAMSTNDHPLAPTLLSVGLQINLGDGVNVLPGDMKRQEYKEFMNENLTSLMKVQCNLYSNTQFS